MEKVQVIYIAGTMRSGSTILGRLLGELPGAVHVGEIGLFTHQSFFETARCECCQLVADCPFWQRVFDSAFGGLDTLDFESLRQTRAEYRYQTLPGRLRPPTADRTRRLQEYLRVLGALYAAIRDVSGADVIVDGTKDPLYGYLLGRVPSVEMSRVDLTRDSRAVAFSLLRVKKNPQMSAAASSSSASSVSLYGGELMRLPVWRSAIYWNLVTLSLLATQNVPARSQSVRYEDFVADPVKTLRSLWDFAAAPPLTPPSLDFLQSAALYSEPVHLHQGHTVAGNPDRFQSNVRLKPDTEWQTKMRPADRRLVTALTLPLLIRYGYWKPLPSPKS